mmetsp:Transcript_2459/g.5839  ORF Transcript_2459/g.5839 Transcript_2459/m.5839 type:complete len:370 (-) Transcript_2459:45-1154(-)
MLQVRPRARRRGRRAERRQGPQGVGVAQAVQADGAPVHADPRGGREPRARAPRGAGEGPRRLGGARGRGLPQLAGVHARHRGARGVCPGDAAVDVRPRGGAREREPGGPHGPPPRQVRGRPPGGEALCDEGQDGELGSQVRARRARALLPERPPEHAVPRSRRGGGAVHRGRRGGPQRGQAARGGRGDGQLPADRARHLQVHGPGAVAGLVVLGRLVRVRRGPRRDRELPGNAGPLGGGRRRRRGRREALWDDIRGVEPEPHRAPGRGPAEQHPAEGRPRAHARLVRGAGRGLDDLGGLVIDRRAPWGSHPCQKLLPAPPPAIGSVPPPACASARLGSARRWEAGRGCRRGGQQKFLSGCAFSRGSCSL